MQWQISEVSEISAVNGDGEQRMGVCICLCVCVWGTGGRYICVCVCVFMLVRTCVSAYHFLTAYRSQLLFFLRLYMCHLCNHQPAVLCCVE